MWCTIPDVQTHAAQYCTVRHTSLPCTFRSMRKAQRGAAGGIFCAHLIFTCAHVKMKMYCACAQRTFFALPVARQRPDLLHCPVVCHGGQQGTHRSAGGAGGGSQQMETVDGRAACEGVKRCGAPASYHPALRLDTPTSHQSKAVAGSDTPPQRLCVHTHWPRVFVVGDRLQRAPHWGTGTCCSQEQEALLQVTHTRTHLHAFVVQSSLAYMMLTACCRTCNLPIIIMCVFSTMCMPSASHVGVKYRTPRPHACACLQPCARPPPCACPLPYARSLPRAFSHMHALMHVAHWLIGSNSYVLLLLLLPFLLLPFPLHPAKRKPAHQHGCKPLCPHTPPAAPPCPSALRGPDTVQPGPTHSAPGPAWSHHMPGACTIAHVCLCGCV